MAVSAAGEVQRGKIAAAGNDGSVSQEEESDAASACHSFGDVVGREAGAIGADGWAGREQHTGVAHLAQAATVWQHWQPAWDWAGRLVERADTAETPCQTRRNPSRMTRAIFVRRAVMASKWSCGTANPDKPCHIMRRLEIISSSAPAWPKRWQRQVNGVVFWQLHFLNPACASSYRIQYAVDGKTPQ